MKVDFKVTTWGRVEVDDSHDEAVMNGLKSGEIKTSNDIIDIVGDNFDYQVLPECETQLTIEENGGDPTIVVCENDPEKWDNTML